MKREVTVREPQIWSLGDRVIHTGKPEWGIGSVVKADASTHNGVKCQRLSIRFARAGLKTLSTAFAALESAGENPAIDAARDPVKAALVVKPSAEPSRRPAPGMLGKSEAPPEETPLDPDEARRIMTKVPEACRDPFRPVEQRIGATLDLYRFTPSGGSLLDWASRQSGLNDPLSAFGRHELEQMFERFRINRDQHLGSLLMEARKGGVDLTALASRAPAQARNVLMDFTRRR